MREILFRGKNDRGEWIEGFYIKDYIGTYIYDKYRNTRMQSVLPETVGQYTGLVDKNGKRIFEGDICQTKGFPLIDELPFVVEWNAEECSFYWQDLQGTDEFTIGVSQNTIIIGNIHDNPELLKGGAE